MSKISFVYGRAHSGKSAFVYDYYCNQMKADPEKRFVFLVPDQMTLGVQKALIKHKDNHSLYHTSVFGFTRLAYKLCEEQHIQIPTVLDEVGKLLLLQKTLQKLDGQLSIFRGNVKKQGFLQSLAGLMTEMTECRITDDIALEAISRMNSKSQLSAKVTDILKIRHEYEALKGKQYITAEDILCEVVKYVAASKLIAGAEVIIDGFSTFTKLQYEIIAEIMKGAEKVTFILDMDSLPEGEVPAEELFYEPKRIYNAVLTLADKLSIDSRDYHYCENNSKEGPIAHLEKTYEQKFAKYDAKPDNIHIVSCHDLSAEIDFVLSKIMELTGKGYHYRDIAIVTTDLPSYAEIIDEKFTEVNIPYFSDHKKSLLHNVAVEGLLAAIAVCDQNFSYEAVMRYLRSGLFEATEELDMLDLYVSAMGIRGESSYKKRFADRKHRPLRFDDELVARIDEYKAEALGSLFKLNSGLKGVSIESRLEAVREWVADIALEEKLEVLEEKLSATDNQLSKIYGQTMTIIDRIITQLQEILGQEDAELSELYRLLEIGFSQMGVGTIPNYLDQIVIGDIKRSRLSNVKVQFVIGMNDKVFPGGESSPGLLSDADRNNLMSDGIELKSTSREQSIVLKYFIYRLLAKPTDALYMSYSNTGEDQKKLFPSYVIGQIKRLFPELEIEPAGRSIYHIKQGLNALADRDEFKLNDEEYEALKREYADRAEYESEFKKIFLAKLDHSQIADVIDEAKAIEIFGAKDGKKPKITVSRLENFAGCEMRHFLRYGLELLDRQTNEIRSVDIGNFYHEILDSIVKTAGDERILLSSSMSDEKKEHLVEAGLKSLLEKFSLDLLTDSSKNAYILEQIREVVRLNLDAILHQLSAGRMQVLATEVSFGMASENKTFRYPAFTIDDSPFDLRGKIDRVDAGMDDDGREILRVIDYKSGSTDFDANKIYEGLQLQLLLYLAALQKNEEKRISSKPVVGGAYYYHIFDDNVDVSRKELVDENGNALDDDKMQELIGDKQRGSMKLSGISASERSTLGIMETAFTNASGVTSEVVKSLNIKNDGNFGAYAKVCTADEFDKLMGYVVDKTKDIGEKIVAGSVKLNPYVDGEMTSCDYCEFKGRCGFEETLGYKYRKLAKGMTVAELSMDSSNNAGGNDGI